jgi:hypothetical protein
MRYALHNVEDSTEVKFPTLDALWQYVWANGLYSQESDAEDASSRLILNPKFEIHDFDACGAVRTIGGHDERSGIEAGTLPVHEQGAVMKFALFRIEGDSIAEFPTMDEVWTYVQANGLCAEEITHEDMPPRRILNPGYAIHTFDPDGELVAMSRMRYSYGNTSEW